MAYLLQQTVIGADPDGTLVAPKAFGPGESHLREVAPGVWREIGGTRQLALRAINGVKTVLDSEDPSSVLQKVPGYLSAPLIWTVLLGSFFILALTSILWPVSYFVRRHNRRALAYSLEQSRLRTFLRVAATVDVLWLACWALVMLPILSTQVDFYSTAHDPLIRTLQLAGVVVSAVAAGGIWSGWRLCRLPGSRPFRLGSGLIVVGLVGLTWIGVIGGLISLNLNY